MSEVERNRAEALRAWADENNSFCVFATLYELSALLDPSTPIPTPEEALEQYESLFGKGTSGAVSPKDFFSTLTTFAEPLRMEISRIMANPSFIDKLEVPDDIQPKLQIVTGRQSVEFPNMRILLKEREKEDWATHAETDDGAERQRTRIEPMLNEGWLTGAVIIFNKGDE